MLFSRAIFFSIFTEVNRSCKYTCSLGMEFFNLQVYNYVMSSNKEQVVHVEVHLIHFQLNLGTKKEKMPSL